MDGTDIAVVLGPRKAGQFIADNSKDVKIIKDGVDKVAKLIFDCVKTKEPVIHVDRWKTQVLLPKTEDQAAVDWVFLSDVGNFSFWSDGPVKYGVTYKGQAWTGYWSWCAAMNRALDEGIPFTSATYLANLTRKQLEYILRSDNQTAMPLLEERLQVLREAGRVLLEKYDGTFVNVVKKSENSAQNLMKIIIQEFPSFRDTAEFHGKRIALYKRVQIVIADIWACCGGKGYGQFDDIDTITMFADYRIPQALVWFGALEYSTELQDALKKDTMFKSGDRMEVEIRGCTIRAVELVVDEVRKMIKADQNVPDSQEINAILVDHYLWDYRREHADETQCIPIHKIRCIYY